jgi:hypothetical protein
MNLFEGPPVRNLYMVPENFTNEGYGSTDLRLDKSTEITKFNQWINQSIHRRKNVSLINL